MKDKTPSEKAMDLICGKSGNPMVELAFQRVGNNKSLKPESKNNPEVSGEELELLADSLNLVVVDGCAMHPEMAKRIESPEKLDSKAKPKKLSTQKKYKKMQDRVDDFANSKKYKYLSHTDICSQIANEFNCAPETIRRNTKLIRD